MQLSLTNFQAEGEGSKTGDNNAEGSGDLFVNIIGFFLVIAGLNSLNHCPESLLLSCILIFLSFCRPPSESSGVAAVPAAQRPLHALQLFRIHRRNVLRRHHLSGERLRRPSTLMFIYGRLRVHYNLQYLIHILNLQEASGSALNAYYANMSVGLTQIVGSVVGTFAVSTVGRRPLLAASRKDILLSPS